MAPIKLYLQLIVPVMACIIIFILILTCLCESTNSSSLQNPYEENVRRSLEMIQNVENELNIIEEQLDIVRTLNDYLHNLHNPQIINDENLVIIVGPDDKTIHLGTKIVD